MAGAFGLVQNHRLAGGRTGVAQTVYLLAVGVGAAEYAQQDFVARAARFPRRLGQVGSFEKHAFGCAAAVVNGRDFDLRHFGVLLM